MSDRRFLLLVPLLAVVGLGSGCAPNLAVVDEAAVLARVPDSYPEQTAPASTDVDGAVTDDSDKAKAVSADWRAFFEEPGLVELVETALDNNQELAVLAGQIDKARAEVTVRRGEYLPKVTGGAEVGMEKVGRYTSQGASDATTEYEPGKEVPEKLPNYMAGFFASWEVDIWHALRDSARQALVETMASEASRRFMVTRLVREIASSYYELLALDNELAVVQENIGLQQDALTIMRLQKQAARVTELAVVRFEAEVLRNRSRLYEIQQQIVEVENRLNLLAGRYPQPIERDASRFAAMTPSPVAIGAPADLLAQRPDVQKAELELEAARLGVKVARARFYPSLGIDAGLGLESFKLRYFLTTPESLLYNAAAGLAVPLLNRKALEGAYASADATQRQALAEYERVLVTAVSEVANRIALIENLDGAYGLKAGQVTKLKNAIDISKTLFQSARADYREVLQVRREALDAQLELIETRRNQLLATVGLYQALGGGWQ